MHAVLVVPPPVDVGCGEGIGVEAQEDTAIQVTFAVVLLASVGEQNSLFKK